MTPEEELYNAHFKIRSWYLKEIAFYRKSLPWEEYKLVKEKLDEIMTKADKYHRTRHPQLMAMLEVEVLNFTAPYEVLVWYSKNPKQG